MAPFDDIVRFTQYHSRFVTLVLPRPLVSSPRVPSSSSPFPPTSFYHRRYTWAEVYALSDQKHENAGEPRLRPAETMKANTGNGKLAGTKERKSGHCELQRTAWKSTVDIQFGQTRGTNKKKKREREGGGGEEKKGNGTDVRTSSPTTGA